MILNRLALLILIVLLGSLCLPAGAANWPDQFYAPYINIEMYAPPTINDVYDATGVKYYSLGFITANTTTGKLRFGDHPEADYYKDQIDTLRTKGGDVIISFGGAFAEKTEPAIVITDLNNLVDAYGSVIDTYGMNYIDFDIEGGALTNIDANSRRYEAILKLKEKYPDLMVSTTIAVMPYGLTEFQLNYLSNATKAEAEYKKNTGKDVLIFDRINIMLMDYGNDYKGDMGQYAIEAATNTNKQLSQGYYSGKSEAEIWKRMGLTPMIGQNDNQYEIFTLNNAKTLAEFAGSNGAGMMSQWSVHRDNGNCPGQVVASPLCSGIVQDPYEFSNILKNYTSMRPSEPAPISSTIWPDQLCAPYIDYGLWQGYTINDAYAATGVKYYTCCFITVNNAGELRFGDHTEADYRLNDINALRANGGDVIISFGGAFGESSEPAVKITDLDKLVDAYSSVIETYGVNYIDFDIEGAAVTNQGANSRRNHAIIRLKEKYPDLKVSTTLAVSPVGFTEEVLAFLSDAKGVEDKYNSENPGKDVLIFDRVNIMLMDYGPSYLGDMGQYAIDASNGVHRQLSQGYYSGKSDSEIWKRMGLTPMIGQNDQEGEIFTLDNARTLAEFAGSNGAGMMSMWSLSRDNSGTVGQFPPSATGSSVQQEPFEFTNIIKNYPSMRIDPTRTPEPTPTYETGLITPTPTRATGLIPEWNSEKEYDTGEIVLYGGSMYAARWWTIDEEPGIEYVWLSTSGKLVPDRATGLMSQWDSGRIYTEGETVIYDDGVYSAKWLTMGEKPGETYVWDMISEIEPEVPVTETVTETETPATGLIMKWDSKTEYDAGDKVLYKGKTYTARWWNVAEPPGHTYSWISDAGEYMPTPTPSSGPAKQWDSRKAYAAGDMVIYNYNRYRASWMNRGEVPGVSYVWELAPEEPTPSPTRATGLITPTPTYSKGLITPTPTRATGLITPNPTPATGLLGG
ncbi:Chitinase [Methanolacinia petrolearia DSM 11571]|uniref:Chitinase n=1 Tax=Methanolacinia petrolearia (strain DSM 11571 / OCM 486 / SEBR 4847) TaxID=679926 RepID=E1RF54_METP4|nr:chitinase [Methanolacinia petrolearia]ADN37298.1 Chitinase [Methanolacinia petrolearia DSM 11571]